MRAARLQQLLADAGIAVDRSGVNGQLVEVYPAAALRAWGFASKGYKRAENRQALVELASSVFGQTGALGAAVSVALEGCDDDDFDAFVCALVARASRSALTALPQGNDVQVARREGWIHVPSVSLEQIVE